MSAPARVTAISSVAVIGAAATGAVVTRLALPVVHGRYFPWIAGRALGLAAYAALTALVLTGLWLRHPWRLRMRLMHPETVLRVHAALAAATLVLVAGHLVSLALDTYAGVGLRGALLPGASGYRAVPVALGVISLWCLVLVAVTARLAPRILGGRWLTVHRLSLAIFAMSFVHGALAGSDTPALRLAYAASGVLVGAAWLTRRLAAPEALAQRTALGGRPA